MRSQKGPAPVPQDASLEPSSANRAAGVSSERTLRAVSPSTIYNQKAVAQRDLRDDDCFFFALLGLGAVRDRKRAETLAAK